MNQVRVLVVEDEPLIAEDIAANLEDIGYAVEGIVHDYASAVEKLVSGNVDFAILDIDLGEDKTGIDVANYISAELGIPFIFLTSFSDSATLAKAKAAHPMGYLVKPIDERDLLTTVEVALFNFSNQQPQQPLEQSKDKLADTIFIKQNGAFVKVKIQDVIRAEAHDNYSFVYTSDKKFLLSNTLKLVEARMKPWGFLRVHRSHLINPELITKVEEGFVFVSETPVPISKKYKADFFEKLNLL